MTQYLKPDWEALNRAFSGNTRERFAFYDESGRIIPIDVVERNTKQWYGSSSKTEHFGPWSTVYALRTMADMRGYGPCIVLRKGDNTTCIDLDAYEAPPNKPHNEADERAHTARIDGMAQDAAAKGNLVERSRSGRGWHIFTRGEWPNRMDDLPNAMGEVFGYNQHINLTGIQISIPTQRPTVDFLGMIRDHMFGGTVAVKTELSASLDLIPTETYGRRLELTDAQVIEALEYMGQDANAHVRNREVYGLFFFCERTMTSHSEDMFKLASALDKITGDHDQVMRLLEASQLYQQQPLDAKGEDRMKKFGRNARKGFFRIRQSNNKALEDTSTFKIWHVYQTWHLTRNVMPSLYRLFGPQSHGSLARKELLAKKEAAKADCAYQKLVHDVEEHQASQITVNENGEVVNTPEMTIPNYLAEWPPGVTGQLAREFYEMMHYPNQSVAVTWAVFMIQGLAQRSFLCEGNPLNGYYLILAGTGEGKDLFSAALTLFFRQLGSSNGRFHSLESNLIGTTEYASGPAIHKELATKPRVISILNEASFLFESLANKSDRLAQEKKRKLLEVRYAGRRNGFLGRYIHSDKEKNTVVAYSPSLHILCEGQPARYYDSLNVDQFIDGFPQRFIIVDVDRQWKGKRRQYSELRHSFSDHVMHALLPMLDVANKHHDGNTPPDFVDIGITPEARELFVQYEDWKDNISKEHQYVRYLAFNRAVATAFSVAGAIACADNSPAVQFQHAQWAIKFVHETIDNLAKKVEANEVGFNQKRQIAAVVKYLKTYHKAKDRRLKPEYISAGIVPLWWLKIRVLDGADSKLFSGNRNRGEVDELLSTLGTMKMLGLIEDIPSAPQSSEGGYRFRILRFE